MKECANVTRTINGIPMQSTIFFRFDLVTLDHSTRKHRLHNVHECTREEMQYLRGVAHAEGAVDTVRLYEDYDT